MTPLLTHKHLPRGGAIRSGTLILLYHRVADLECDPQLLAVTPKDFEKHLAHLSRRFDVLPLSELVRTPGRLRDHRPKVVLTFDDGYADNLENALPILERHCAPATIFVAAQDHTGNHEFWWDELEDLVLLGELPTSHLKLAIGGVRFVWDLPRDWLAPPQAIELQWNVVAAADPTPRQALYLALARLLKPLPASERESVIGHLAAWAEKPRRVRPTHRRLDRAQLCRLNESPLIEIGCHTLTHPQLSALSPADQRYEIVEAKRLLEAAVGEPVRSFSYPYGTPQDYLPATVNLVREAGFTAACANTGRDPHPRCLVAPQFDLFRIPRAIVRDWPCEEFAERLESVWPH